MASSSYKSISPGNLKLDLAGLIAAVPSSTSKRLSISCPPNAVWPPPCYMGVGMNSYVRDSEDMPQWRGDAYLLTNSYRFYVENARTNAWMSALPESSPGKLCYVDVTGPASKPFSGLAAASYVVPVVALLPGAALGGAPGIIIITTLVAAGILGTLYAYYREKSTWVGPDNDDTRMRMLIFCPGDKWYMFTGQNKDLKCVTAGSAISNESKWTFVLYWLFKIAVIAVVLSAANAHLLVQVGLIVAYAGNTLVCEILIASAANKTVINRRMCNLVRSVRFVSKQEMLDYVESEGIGDDVKNWRHIFGLTVKPTTT